MNNSKINYYEFIAYRNKIESSILLDKHKIYFNLCIIPNFIGNKEINVTLFSGEVLEIIDNRYGTYINSFITYFIKPFSPFPHAVDFNNIININKIKIDKLNKNIDKLNKLSCYINDDKFSSLKSNQESLIILEHINYTMNKYKNWLGFRFDAIDKSFEEMKERMKNE